MPSRCIYFGVSLNICISEGNNVHKDVINVYGLHQPVLAGGNTPAQLRWHSQGEWFLTRDVRSASRAAIDFLMINATPLPVTSDGEENHSPLPVRNSTPSPTNALLSKSLDSESEKNRHRVDAQDTRARDSPVASSNAEKQIFFCFLFFFKYLPTERQTSESFWEEGPRTWRENEVRLQIMSISWRERKARPER